MALVVGLDLSLTRTGLARVLCGNGSSPPVVRLCTIDSKPPKVETIASRAARLNKIKADLFNLFGRPSLVVIEGPAYMSDVGKAHDRSGLWWLITAHLAAAGVPVAEIPPNNVKVYAHGKVGSKDEVLAAMIHRHPTAGITDNNTADALALAAMGARHLGHPIESRALPQTCLRAMIKTVWPNP